MDKTPPPKIRGVFGMKINFGDLAGVEYYFIVITPMSTLTCNYPIYKSNKYVKNFSSPVGLLSKCKYEHTMNAITCHKIPLDAYVCN